MPTNLQAQLRLKTIDKCLRDKTRVYSMDDLMDVVTEALHSYKVKVTRIGRRTVYKDIAYMRKHFNAEIEITKELGYYYTNPTFSIFKTDLKKTDVELIKEVIGTLNTISSKEHFQGLDEALNTLEEAYNLNVQPDTKSVILFETSPNEEGKKWIQRLKTSIRKKETINVQYQPFDKDVRTIKIFPYLLKEYNNRWFLFCQEVGSNGMKRFPNTTTLGLDRIMDVTSSLLSYADKQEFDFDTYSKDIIGVTKPEGDIQDVVFKVKFPRYRYIETKPMHTSQEIQEKTENSCTFKISVKPNKEMYSKLLSFGADLEVISPEFVRQKIGSEINRLRQLYPETKKEVS